MANGKNLRVLHVVGQYLTMHTNWIYRLISNLPGVEVAVASKYFLKCNFYSPSIQYLEFPLQRVPQPARRRLWIRAFNGIVHGASRFYPWYVSKMAGEVSLIHAHFADVGWDYLPLARRMGVPYVVSFYGYDYEYLPHNRPEWRERYQMLFAEADTFVCEGPHGAEIMQRIGCPREKIRVVGLGLQPTKIPFYQRKKPRDILHLLQIASLTEKKGHVYAVQAFQQALKECPNMTLTIVGRDPGHGQKDIMRRLKSVGASALAEGKLRFLEGVSYDHLYSFMEKYHVFIHPSCYTEQLDCEGGAPVVLLDAQATGMPVIATTHCDIPQEVIHLKTGLLSPEKEIDQLAQSIKRFYRMPTAEYEGFSSSAREHVERHFDIAANAAVLAALYREVVLKNRKSGLP